MSKINFKQAKDSLEKINQKDKVAIICHDDVDGIASGVLLFRYLQNKKIYSRIFVFPIGDNQQAIIEKTKKYNKTIIADLGSNAIQEILKAKNSQHTLYIDHHIADKPIPKKILEFRTTSQGYIPSSRTVQELVGIEEWLGVAGTIADVGYKYKENFNYIQSFLKKEKIKFEYFKKQIVYPLIAILIFYEKNILIALKKILKINSYKQIKLLKKYDKIIENEKKKVLKEFKKKQEKFGDIIFYFLNPKYAIKSILASSVSAQYPKKIIIFATPNDKKTIQTSIRTQRNDVNLIELIEYWISGIKKVSSGGHKKAAGVTILKKDMAKFKENLKNYSKTFLQHI